MSSYTKDQATDVLIAYAAEHGISIEDLKREDLPENLQLLYDFIK